LQDVTSFHFEERSANFVPLELVLFRAEMLPRPNFVEVDVVEHDRVNELVALFNQLPDAEKKRVMDEMLKITGPAEKAVPVPGVRVRGEFAPGRKA
jgi:hypothetical protein